MKPTVACIGWISLILATALVARSALAADEAVPARRSVAPAVAGSLAPPAAASVVLPSLTVTATRLPMPAFDVPAAISVVTQQEIVDGAPAVSLSQSLARVPGVVAQNRQSYAQDSQLSIRGFGARASFGVRDIRLLVDGIPASDPDGQGETDTFDLASAARIEVLRGPFSALYGNAAGGVIQIFTKDGPLQPTLGAATLVGSYGTRIQRLDAGGTAGDFNYSVDAMHFYTRGYRAHSSAERDNLRAKLGYTLGSDSALTLLVNGENQPYAEDPSGLTKAQAEADPRQAVPAVFTFGAGESHRARQVGAVYDQTFGENDRLRVTAYSGTRRVLQFLPFAGTSANGGGAVVDLHSRSSGGGARWTHDFALAGGPLDLIGGIDYDHLDQLRKGWVNADGSEGALRRNENDDSSQSGEYLQAQWKPGRWSVLAGLRHSHVGFASDDHYITDQDPDDSGARSFSSTDPVAGALYQITPRLNVYANYGRGFETPTLAEFAYQADGAAGFNQDLQPSTSRNLETGLKARWGSATFDLAAFAITTDDEIVVAGSNNGRTSYRNAGGTLRHGLELSFNTALAGGFSLYAAYSYLHARFADSALDGKRLPGVPQQTFYGELDWQYRPLGFTTSVNLQWCDRVYVDDANSQFADGYAVVNYQLGFEQHAGAWRLSEFARIDNLLDRHYIGAVIVNASNGRFFEPEPDRNFMFGLQASFTF